MSTQDTLKNGDRPPTVAQQIARFAASATYGDIPEGGRQRLKTCVLDAIGCAIGALEMEPMQIIRDQIDDFGGTEHCTLIGGGRSAPDRTALYNGALVGYLDFNDSYLGRNGTCHPSDNLAGVLAAAEYADRTGSELLTALAVAYEVQCRLTESLPIMKKGFDHSTLLTCASAAGISRALGLDEERTANAIAIGCASALALTATQSYPLSQWKGLAAARAVSMCTSTTFLAMRGITGPMQVFEGRQGLFETVNEEADIDWEHAGFEHVAGITLKKYDAEVHAQSVVAATLALRERHAFSPADVEAIDVEVFSAACEIAGAGTWGGRRNVHTREDADHSIPYLAAVAILDGQVQPAQYVRSRILSRDVQDLLQRVSVHRRFEYTRRYPEEVPCRVAVELRDGRTFSVEVQDFEGFHSRPMPLENVVEKFRRLASPCASAELQERIIETAVELEGRTVAELTGLLARPCPPDS